MAAIGTRKCARTQTELDPASGQDVERRGATCEDGGRAQRDVGHVGKKPNALRPAAHIRKESPGIEKCRLVRMVLKACNVQAEVVGQLDRGHDGLVLARAWRYEDAEEEIVVVVGHRLTS
jgi:hypothetical protein